MGLEEGCIGIAEDDWENRVGSVDGRGVVMEWRLLRARVWGKIFTCEV